MNSKRYLMLALLIGLVQLGGFLRAQEGDMPQSRLEIADARLGTNVENRELVGEDSTFMMGSKVFLWMRVTGGESDQITVTWKSGDLTHSTTLMVGGNPWRTWATKTLTVAGDWTVTVTDTDGNVLKEMMFRAE